MPTTRSSSSPRSHRNSRPLPLLLSPCPEDAPTTSATTAVLPKLIVFDLDNTIWTPELYQLRRRRNSELNSNNSNGKHNSTTSPGNPPVAHVDVKLMGGAVDAFERKRSIGGDLEHTLFAIASRTKSVEWAHDLLDQFHIRHLFEYVEIFPGSKTRHFSNIAAASGIAYHDMLFFDDARDGKFGNCVPVADMGVLAVHCPTGLTDASILSTALQRLSGWDKTAGTVIEWDGKLSSTSTTTSWNSTAATALAVNTKNDSTKLIGKVKYVNAKKRYGFVENGGDDVFFHFKNLPTGSTTNIIRRGVMVSFVLEHDPKRNKSVASSLEVIVPGDRSKPNDDEANIITMPALSMRMPFAALLTNGYKSLETRNGNMFTPYPERTKMLVHVGMKSYPDKDRHVEVMKSGGLSDLEIARLKTLPTGYDRGMVIAVCEIGRTCTTTERQRSTASMERKIGAFGADSGRWVTEIRRVEYLKGPIRVSGKIGIFRVSIDSTFLPEKWL
jgi:magnesium-dependent phosphatase 1